MSIKYLSAEKTFKIDTKNTSYVFCISDNKYLEHLYYGQKIPDDGIRDIADREIYSFVSKEQDMPSNFSTSTILCENSVFSSGDIRVPSVIIDYKDAPVSNRFRYVSHKIFNGRVDIVGMPSSRDKNCETLEVILQNDLSSMTISLYYTVYNDYDVICRYSKITNNSDNSVYLNKFSSMCLDFYGHDKDLITLAGRYAAERVITQRTPLNYGIQGNSSIAGCSSHHTNPFFALCDKNADENYGDVVGINLVYSGNFSNEIEVDRNGNTRIVSGINGTGFRWELKSNQSFYSPESVITFTKDGIGGMSRNMHDHIRDNIIEEKFSYKKRPIVINTWEGSHFDVNEKLVLEVIDSAKKCGIDTIVIDDGWFRKNDTCGLGDFYTDKNRFPSGLKRISEIIHENGLNFGIWIEPEMVSVDSELIRKDKNIVLSAERNPIIYRNQFVIDLTVDENIYYVLNRLKEEFDGVKIDYLKIDYNRYIFEHNSICTPQGETCHRQVLGMYKLIGQLKKNMPNTMFETCSGGGGRFDLGMLYFSPQIWTSDNTDTYNRIDIQYGTSIAYPQSTISCHFTKGMIATNRPSTFDFRFLVATFGPFGYELDLSKFSDAEMSEINRLNREYRKFDDMLLSSDLYRLSVPSDKDFCSYVNVSKDKNKALYTYLQINVSGLFSTTIIKLKGLDANKKYKNSLTGKVSYGSTLMNVGLRIKDFYKGKSGYGFRILFESV